MKISLNWIFDHIKADINQVDVALLVDTFIKKTAEIEEWRAVSLNADDFTLVQVTGSATGVTAFSPELKKDFSLSDRMDVIVGAWYLIDNTAGQWHWSTIRSVGGTKDTLLPALYMQESLSSGGWKKNVEWRDCIIEVDNKSINHRPDLWGHRGIAREIAALLNVPLKNVDAFFIQGQKEVKTSQLQGKTGDFSVLIEAHGACQRFAALYIESIEHRSSALDMAMRLARVDSKAIDYIVDCTNYVMLDLGHPMHAFDAQQLSQKNIIVRRARDKEKLTLLDGEVLELTSQDTVIADGAQAVSLAGVMGGAATGVTSKTQSLLIEAALFDAATIRRTAARYKKRTDASMRFEKHLDPNNIDNPLLRFLFLLNKGNIAHTVKSDLIVLGNENGVMHVEVEHARIEQLLGTTIDPHQVEDILEKLSFTVVRQMRNNQVHYEVTAPSFRATKEKLIAEDIIEEVGRFIGYDSIEPRMPYTQLVARDLHKTYNIRAIKQALSNGLMMRELYGYSFFDESFLREINYNPDQCIEMKNPISENYTRLVSTLQPHLLKAVKDNSIDHTQLRFYEYARVFKNADDGAIIEKKSLSGIFFDRTKQLDFYQGKRFMSQLFGLLPGTVLWQRNDDNEYPWLSQHKTARIVHNGVSIGVAGMVEEKIMDLLCPATATAFVFELDGDYLVNYKRPVTRFSPLAKYPAVYRDVSMMIPLSVTVEMAISAIKAVDTRVKEASLIDFFTKQEWKDQKSLTFHVEMRDENKTFDHDEIEALWSKVVTALEKLGAVIR